MGRARYACALTLLAAFAPALAGAQPASPPADAGRADCEARIQALEQSSAEGAERLAEKNEAIAVCSREHRRSPTIMRLVSECAKYEKQPIVQQQFVAECQLAAFNYANALQTAKSEFNN